MLAEMIPLLTLGFGLGLMHALDADHVMAVSTLSVEKPSLKRTLLFSANWALGHGGVLLLSGALLFGLGFAIPEALQKGAEVMVGVLLIVLGLWCFRQFRKEKLNLKTHTHGDVEHTHWQDDSHTEKPAKEGHKPVFVGILHGLAGSAPALALIPAVSQGQMAVAMGYLVIFSLGVMISMVGFGLGFGSIQHYLKDHYQKIFQLTRTAVALASIIIGSVWVVKAI